MAQDTAATHDLLTERSRMQWYYMEPIYAHTTSSQRRPHHTHLSLSGVSDGGCKDQQPCAVDRISLCSQWNPPVTYPRTILITG